MHGIKQALLGLDHRRDPVFRQVIRVEGNTFSKNLDDSFRPENIVADNGTQDNPSNYDPQDGSLAVGRPTS
jgi:hypothetical protein